MRYKVLGWPSCLVVLLLLAGILLLGACLPAMSGATEQPAAPTAPRHESTNVILVSLQCLRPDHLGLYGYQRQTSPNIDALAGTSVVFENAIAQAALTPVAQMSVFTSQYPRVNGMVSFEIAKEAVTGRTLPATLKYYGYTTAAVTSSPEFFLRYDTEAGTMVNPGDLFSLSFDTFLRTKRSAASSVRKVPTEALQWIRDNKEKKFFLWIASGLLHMPYGAAVPREQRGIFDPPGYKPFWQRLPQVPADAFRGDDPSYEVFSRVYHNTFYWGFAPIYQLTAEDVGYLNARYDAGVHATDNFIGNLRQLLDALDLTRKTLLIIQSIHGDDLGERGRYFHYDVTDAVIKNALIMTFPGGEFVDRPDFGSVASAREDAGAIDRTSEVSRTPEKARERPTGRRITAQVQALDIMPTILDYLGIPPPHEAQGGSLLPMLKGEQAGPPSEFAYIERMPWWEYTLSKWYLEFLSAKGGQFPPEEKEKLAEYLELLRTRFAELDSPPGDVAIRTREWKLVLRKNIALLNQVSWWRFITGTPQDVEEIELYDLLQDPGEKKNVVGEHPDVVARLKDKLLQWDDAVEKNKAVYSKEGKRFIIPYP